MDEFELIRRYFVRPPDEAGGVRVGVGDDGAVLEPSKGRALVAVVDTLVEGVHWPAELPPADVGFRAVAVNVSDVAAMGGWPRWMTLALTLAEADERWLDEFTAGLFQAAEQFGTALVGGDTTRGAQTVVTVQVTGEVDPVHVLTRSGARPGDGLYVTGTTGDAAAGLRLLGTRSEASEADREYLVARFARPRVSLDFAVSIARIASAAIDVSDGLYADAAKLLAACIGEIALRQGDRAVGELVEHQRRPETAQVVGRIGDHPLLVRTVVEVLRDLVRHPNQLCHVHATAAQLSSSAPARAWRRNSSCSSVNASNLRCQSESSVTL